jgi:hypothetical protein
MNTCDTCKYFSESPYRIDPPLGNCAIWDDNVVEIPKEATQVAHGVQSDAFIMVGPKFGCIHHNPK